MLSEPFSAAPAAGFPSTKHKRLGTEVKHLIACPFLFLQANYYRPQSSDTCYPCDCFPSGSHTRSCDMETGQCPCKPGVIGRQCNRCDNPFAEVTARGCEGTAQPDTLPISGGVGSGGSGVWGGRSVRSDARPVPRFTCPLSLLPASLALPVRSPTFLLPSA